ncbi:MAG: fibronectin type III domain-containing protein [Clostridia bacterium]|nr:fibronectin type III domain-containing protein [Clostridia bacterium]
MKTLKRVLCVILSVLMAMSCLSAVALAADAENNPQFTDSFRYYTDKADSYGTDKLLDLVDMLLKDADIREEIDLGVTTLVVDFTSVNALCGTIDDYSGVLKLATVLAGGLLGDLKDLDLSTWKKGMKRSASNDETIIKEIFQLVNANSGLVEGICTGELDMGIFADYIDLKELLGEDGVSGLIKEMILGDDYEEYKNNVDGFVYGKINELAAEYLPGFTITGESEINSLICLLFSVVLNEYALPALKELNIDLAAQENEVLKKLNGHVVLNGAAYNFENIAFDPEKSFLDQVNNEVGKIFSQVVPGYTWVAGGYDKISTNIEGACEYLGTATGIIPDAASMSFEEIVKEVVSIILSNIDLGTYGEGVMECSTFEDMLKVVLVNTANELEIGVTYGKNDTYLVVLGDIVAHYAYNIIDLEDANGKDYRAGGGKDIFEVANYIANYFLLDKGVAKLLGLSVTKTDSIFTKVDKLLDYFGETKAKGVSFDSKKFLLGNSTTKGLLDSVFSLDIQNIIEITAVPALNAAGDVKLEQFIYNSVRYCINNWAGNSTMIPAYKSGASFTNALSNDSIGNLVTVLLSVINARSDSLITLVATVMSVISSYKVTSTIYAVMEFIQNDSSAALDEAKEKFGDLEAVFDMIKGFVEDNKDSIDGLKPYIDVIAEKSERVYAATVQISDFVCNGKTATPTVTVKAGGKTLTQNKDYVVKTTDSAIGKATATIEGIGLYEGSFTASYNIVLGAVGTVKMSQTTNTVTLSWGKVYNAVKYNVYMLVNGKYVLKQSTAATSYKATGLAAGTAYSFKIEAVDANGVLSKAKAVSTKTAPAAVAAKSIKLNATDTTVAISWTKVAGATGYRIERLVNGKWQKVDTTANTTYTVKKLTPYTKYQFRVVSYLKDQNGTYIFGAASAAKAVTTDVSTISGLKATTTSKTIKLTWKKATNVSGYQIQQYKGGKWVTIATIKKAATTSYTIKKLAANTKYQLRIRAYNGKVYGDWAKLTVNTNLVQTKNVKVSKATTNSVTLKWNKVKGATGYEVYQYKNSKWVLVKTVNSATSATISKLKAGTTYKFYVRAFKKSGKTKVYGDNSATISAKTSLGQVQNLKASARKKTSITLKWNKVTGATGYYVERYNGKKWVKVATVKKTTYTNNKLTRSTQYQYRVRAYGTVNGKTATGAYSKTLKARTTIF